VLDAGCWNGAQLTRLRDPGSDPIGLMAEPMSTTQLHVDFYVGRLAGIESPLAVDEAPRSGGGSPSTRKNAHRRYHPLC
jgi:hypothetical protein